MCCSDRTDIGEHAHRRERAVAGVLPATGAREEGAAADGGEARGGARAAAAAARQVLRRRVRRQRRQDYAGSREELREYPRVHKERDILQAAAQVRGAEAAQEGRQQGLGLQTTVCAHTDPGSPAGRDIRRRQRDRESSRVYDESR